MTPLRLLLILTTLALSACSTPLIQVSTSPTIPSVPCVSINQIKYHAPKNVTDVVTWQSGHLWQGQPPAGDNDPYQGHYDRPDDAQAIRENNAAIGAVCTSK